MTMFFTTTTMSSVTLLGIGGSTRANSHNGAALRAALARAEALGAATEMIDLHACHFPLLDRDRPLEDYPDDVVRYLDAVRLADGFILESPTYHGSMSGAFKNALDLLIYGDESYFGGKPVGLMALGGANGAPVLDTMTTTVHALQGLVVPTRVLIPHGGITSDGTVSEPAMVERLDRMVAQLIRIATALHYPNQESELAVLARVS